MDHLFTVNFSGKGCSVESEESVRTCDNDTYGEPEGVQCKPIEEHLLKLFAT